MPVSEENNRWLCSEVWAMLPHATKQWQSQIRLLLSACNSFSKSLILVHPGQGDSQCFYYPSS